MRILSSTNLSKEMFPDPNKRGLFISPVCPDIEILAWNLLLSTLDQSKKLKLQKVTTIGFQNKRKDNNTLFKLTNSKNQGIIVMGETPGLVTHNFPSAGMYTMRGLLGYNPRLKKDQMIASVEKRKIKSSTQREIISKIDNDQEFWFVNVFTTMLAKVGVRLSKKEEKQMISNIEWFYTNYYSFIKNQN